MLDQLNEVFLHLKERVNNYDEVNTNTLECAKQIANDVIQHLDMMKGMVYAHNFEHQDQEIFFFKNIKPHVVKYLHYCTYITRVETNVPLGGNKELKAYYKEQLSNYNELNHFQKAFWQYLRSGATNMDAKYFLRKREVPIAMHDVHYCERDPNFSTPYDNLTANLLAREKMAKFVQLKIKRNCRQKNTPQKAFPKLTWTGTKAEAVELIYALKENASISNGNITVNQLSELFQAIFDLNLKDPHRTFSDIKSRSNPTQFLDNLKSSIRKKLDEEAA